MNIITVDIDVESLDMVVGEIRKIGVQVIGKVVDVSDRGQMAKLADDACERFGNVNIICNNAGIGP